MTAKFSYTQAEVNVMLDRVYAAGQKASATRALEQRCEHTFCHDGATPHKAGDRTPWDLACTTIAAKICDPRDPRSEEEMVGRNPIFRYHNCYRCQDGARACVQGCSTGCEFPHARND